MKQLVAICIKGYYGDDTSIECSPQDELYAVFRVEEKKTSFVDGGYRSLDELKKAWPDVKTEVADG